MDNNNDCSLHPFVPKGSHPIETGRYLIATNEVDKMFSKVSQWIENRSPGGIIYGRPRIGKTRAILYLMHILPFEFGSKIPIFRVNCKQHPRPNEGIFYEEILTDLCHGLPSSGKPHVKRDRIIKFLLERGEASEQNRIIVFMDDAQRLVELHYGWLMDIYNDLDRSGTSMTVILVGQEELLYQRSAFVQSKKAQIVGRFMVHEHQFIGIKSVADLKICLRGYDEDCEYPEKTGWSFTKYFFPDAYSDGFRLESCAEELFEAWINIRNESGFKRPIEIPMQYITLTIEYALRKFGVNGLGCHSISKSQWSEAIARSGYIESEVYQEIV